MKRHLHRIRHAWLVANIIDTLSGCWQAIRPALPFAAAAIGTLPVWAGVLLNSLEHWWQIFALAIPTLTAVGWSISQGVRLRSARRLLTSTNESGSDAPTATFIDVARKIKPLLDANGEVFARFGPNSDANAKGPARFDLTLWQKAKGDVLVPNNNQISTILVKYHDVIPSRHHTVVEKMKAHIYAFSVHVSNPEFDYSEYRFPTKFRKLIDKEVRSG